MPVTHSTPSTANAPARTRTANAPLPVRFVLRGNQANPNANMWLNRRGRPSGGIWHINYIVYNDQGSRLRRRFSLQTKDVLEARRKRDAILATMTARYAQGPQGPKRPSGSRRASSLAA